MTIERDWYGSAWRFLRSQILKLALRHGDPLLKAAVDGSSLPVTDFMNKIITDINEKTAIDTIGLWQNALPLLIQVEWLEKELNKDRIALSGKKNNKKQKIMPKQALSRKLSLFLEMNRRQHLAAALGVSNHRVKNWERLDRISRSITGVETANRCTEEHFIELAAYIKKHYTKDRNLPRKANKVQEYFYQFSRDCTENIEAKKKTMDNLSLQEAQEMLQGVALSELMNCLQQLPPELMEAINTAFQLGLTRSTYLSCEHYIKEKRITSRQFEQMQEAAIESLRCCLEAGLAAKQGGTV